MDSLAKPIPGFDEFSNQVNSIFVAPDEDGGVEFQLIEAKELFSDERFQSFSLLFQASSSFASRQGTFNLKNEQLGDLELFLVPIRQTEKGVVLEASFNLVR